MYSLSLPYLQEWMDAKPKTNGRVLFTQMRMKSSVSLCKYCSTETFVSFVYLLPENWHENTKFQGSGDVGRGLPGNSQASEMMDGHLSLSCTSQMRKLKKKKKKIRALPNSTWAKGEKQIEKEHGALGNQDTQWKNQ